MGLWLDCYRCGDRTPLPLGESFASAIAAAAEANKHRRCAIKMIEPKTIQDLYIAEARDRRLQENLLQAWQQIGVKDYFLSRTDLLPEGQTQNIISSLTDLLDLIRDVSSPQNVSICFDGEPTGSFWQAIISAGGSSYSSDRHLEKATALVLAYLRMLADQRSIAPGTQWQHFKGDAMTVVAEARKAYPGGGSRSLGVYTIEEDPTQNVELFTRPDGTFVYFSGNTIPQSNRVFYTHNGEPWTRTRSNFLSLVGSEHPQGYGLLRFADVGNKKGEDRLPS
jgi:hypothetical protein